MTMTRDEMLVLLAKLKTVRRTGTLEVRYTDGNVSREVRYRSDKELAAAIRDLEGEIAGLDGKPGVSAVYVRSEKGWV